ncbi:hypothetical protein EON65_12740 [archaeon]|nr:MAG: hypothetical protein EON65_12740 [archaeon]
MLISDTLHSKFVFFCLEPEAGLHVVSKWRMSDRRPKSLVKEEGGELFAQDDQSLSEFYNGRLCVRNCYITYVTAPCAINIFVV